MAVFSIEIADQDIERIISAVCSTYNYNAQVIDPDYVASDPEAPPVQYIDNPENPYQFVNRITRQYLTTITTDYERQVALRSAEQALSASTAPQITDPAV